MVLFPMDISIKMSPYVKDIKPNTELLSLLLFLSLSSINLSIFINFIIGWRGSLGLAVAT